MQDQIFAVMIMVVFAACIVFAVVRSLGEARSARRGRSTFRASNRFQVAPPPGDVWSLN